MLNIEYVRMRYKNQDGGGKAKNVPQIINEFRRQETKL